MKKDAAGVYPYSSIFDAIAKVLSIHLISLPKEKESPAFGLDSRPFTLE